MINIFKRLKQNNKKKLEEKLNNLTNELSKLAYEKSVVEGDNRELKYRIETTERMLEVSDRINEDILLTNEANFNNKIGKLKIETKDLKRKNRDLDMKVSVLTTNKNTLTKEVNRLKDRNKGEILVRTKPIDQNQEIYQRYVKFLEEKALSGKELDHFEHLSLRYRFLPMSRKVERVGGSYDRFAYEKALPNTVDDIEWKKILERFDNKCALSGIEENVSFEHFIPINTGHGGTHKGNIIPLNVSLNYSKNNRNPFYWFSKNDFPVAFTMESWDQLIQYLAKENNLEVYEYVEFVNWCFDNPRTIDQIKADGDISSIELWKSNTKQLLKAI